MHKNCPLRLFQWPRQPQRLFSAADDSISHGRWIRTFSPNPRGIICMIAIRRAPRDCGAVFILGEEFATFTRGTPSIRSIFLQSSSISGCDARRRCRRRKRRRLCACGFDHDTLFRQWPGFMGGRKSWSPRRRGGKDWAGVDGEFRVVQRTSVQIAALQLPCSVHHLLGYEWTRPPYFRKLLWKPARKRQAHPLDPGRQQAFPARDSTLCRCAPRGHSSRRKAPPSSCVLLPPSIEGAQHGANFRRRLPRLCQTQRGVVRSRATTCFKVCQSTRRSRPPSPTPVS